MRTAKATTKPLFLSRDKAGTAYYLVVGKVPARTRSITLSEFIARMVPRDRKAATPTTRRKSGAA
jgi:hypothetical protein